MIVIEIALTVSTVALTYATFLDATKKESVRVIVRDHVHKSTERTAAVRRVTNHVHHIR